MNQDLYSQIGRINTSELQNIETFNGWLESEALELICYINIGFD